VDREFLGLRVGAPLPLEADPEVYPPPLIPLGGQAIAPFPVLTADAGVDPDKFTRLFWHSENIGSSNLGAYGNSEVDRLIEAGRTSLDTEERRRLYRRIHALIARDHPAVFLYVRKIFFATSARLDGINTAPELFYQSIKDWYINPSQQERR